jgi:hypothetical protein
MRNPRYTGRAIGNPRLPKNHRTWEYLILTDQRNELIVEQYPPVRAVNDMTYAVSWRNEILATLMGATYDSQVDCPDSPFQHPSKFIRHLADWVGELKQTDRGQDCRGLKRTLPPSQSDSSVLQPDPLPESRGAAALDRRHYLQLAETDMTGIGLPPCRAM